MQRTFPFVNASNVRAGKVCKSTWCLNNTVIQWYGYIERKDYEGYIDAGNWQNEPTPHYCTYWWQ